MTNQRDTQFAGFAKLLWDELHMLTLEEFNSKNFVDAGLKQQRLIARRAYDLASHVVGSCVDQEEECRHRCYKEELLKDIPDITEWPDQKGM